MTLTFTLDGQKTSVTAEPNKPLSLVLLEEKKTKGIRKNCQKGFCGCCFVLFNKKPIPACSLPFFAVEGATITTIGEISKTPEFIEITDFLKNSSVYLCSYCAPSRILVISSLLAQNEKPSPDKIKEVVCAVSCLCTGPTALEAALTAWIKLRGPYE